MGWFWAETSAKRTSSGTLKQSSSSSPPPSCPMHTTPTPAPESACPYNPGDKEAVTPSAAQKPCPKSTLDAFNPLNYMPANLSQSRESTAQQRSLPTSRETSSIPRGDTQESNWVYPSPQQMYNAMLRKGYQDTPEDAVESMVAIHNFLNEGAWAEIIEWERRFGKGLMQGWKECAYGEDGSVTGAMIAPDAAEASRTEQPRLLRFMGRADAMTPKAYMLQNLGWLSPQQFGGSPPFDRHDWYVERRGEDGSSREVRYIIDYYTAPPEKTGEPVFYLDIRPALDGPSAAAERLIRWGRDVWWRGSGAKSRMQDLLPR